MIPRTPSCMNLGRSAACTFAVRKITGIELVPSCCCSARKVLGPSMSGIITWRRIASGLIDRASAAPAFPPFAVFTVQASVNSRLSVATSRMSSSSSITNSCLCGMQPLRVSAGNGLEEPDHVPFEIRQTAPALGQELRRSEPESRLIGISDFQRRIDEKGDATQRRSLAQRGHDREAVHIGQDEIENDQARFGLSA